MRATPVVAVLGTAAATLAALVAPAHAGEANGASDTGGISAGATDGHQETGTGAGPKGGGTVPMCTPGDGGEPGPVNWRPVPEQFLTEAQREQAAAEGGGWYWRYCGDQADVKIIGTDNGAAWFPPGGASGPAPDPGALASEALQRTPLPEPVIRMNPEAPVPLLVGLPTFLWIDPAAWVPQTASASAGSVTSTVTAVPQRVVWDMGQGDTVTCDGPGRPYTPGLDGTASAAAGACTFTYPFSSARSASPDSTFTVMATVQWHATWTASGAAGGGDLGTVEQSSSVTVQVAELQSLNANPRADP